MSFFILLLFLGSKMGTGGNLTRGARIDKVMICIQIADQLTSFLKQIVTGYFVKISRKLYAYNA